MSLRDTSACVPPPPASAGQAQRGVRVVRQGAGGARRREGQAGGGARRCGRDCLAGAEQQEARRAHHEPGGGRRQEARRAAEDWQGGGLPGLHQQLSQSARREGPPGPARGDLRGVRGALLQADRHAGARARTAERRRWRRLERCTRALGRRQDTTCVRRAARAREARGPSWAAAAGAAAAARRLCGGSAA